MGSNAQERRDNLGLGLRNAVSFNSEDKGALDYRPLKGSETSRLDEVADVIRNQPLRPEYQSQQIDNLVAEACARTECANGIPVSDPHYVKLKELEAKGKALIDDGQAYLANEDDLFKYGRMDKINDFLRREDEIVTRIEGGAVAITGTYGAVTTGAAAVATSPACSTGVGCLAPIGLAGLSALSADAAHDGWQKALGDYSSHFGQEVINNFGTGTAHDPSSPLFDLGLGLATELGLYGIGRYVDQISDGIDGTIRYVSPTGKQVEDSVSYDDISAHFSGKTNSFNFSGLADAEVGGTRTINYDILPSTTKPSQSAQPRDLNEQLVWDRVKSDPSSGQDLGLAGDSRFPRDEGWSKRQITPDLPDGSSITIHYQYNSNTGKPYDMKITTPQPDALQPGPSFQD